MKPKQKRIAYCIAIVLLLGACRPRLDKPFTITSKDWNNEGKCRYYYQDTSGNGASFIDVENKYNVGDIIK